MPYDENGEYYRMKASTLKCAVCELKFLAGREPRPDQNGRRVCRDCRCKHGLPEPDWTPLQSL